MVEVGVVGFDVCVCVCVRARARMQFQLYIHPKRFFYKMKILFLAKINWIFIVYGGKLHK